MRLGTTWALLTLSLSLLFLTPAVCAANEHTEGFSSWPKWALIVFCLVTVVLAAMYCGLTIGLLGMDTITLEIIADAGPLPDAKYARRILPVRKLGHQLLATLLLGNMLTLVLSSQLLAAIVNSTELVNFIVGTLIILIFGELIPMSYCNKGNNALAAGSKSLPALKVSLFVLYPIAKPLGMILDRVVSHDAGQLYDRNELKKLICMYCDKFACRTDIDWDQGTMMLRALEMSEITVDAAMTPIDKTYMLEANTVVDGNLKRQLWECGKSRIPLYSTTRDRIIGVLYVKDLINPAITWSPTGDGKARTLRDVLTLFPRDFYTIQNGTQLRDTLCAMEKAMTQILFVVKVPPQPTDSTICSSNGMLTDARAEEPAAVKKCPSKEEMDVVHMDHVQRSSMMTFKPTVLLSNNYSPPFPVVGLVTLEDLIEKLIASEIYDEDEVTEEDVPANRTCIVADSHLTIPSAPTKAPRTNLYSFLIDPSRDAEADELTDSQRWALSGFLTRAFVFFASWSIPQVKVLLDDVGTRRVLIPTPLSASGYRSTYSFVEVDPQDVDRSRVLYAANQPTTTFTLLLSGSVQLIVGQEGFASLLHSFSSLGEQVLSSAEPFVPDFTAVVTQSSRLLCITHSDLYRVERTINARRSTNHQKPIKLTSFDVGAPPREHSLREAMSCIQWEDARVLVE